jgi:hypothetical protein
VTDFEFSRQVCIERMYFDGEWMIRPVVLSKEGVGRCGEDAPFLLHPRFRIGIHSVHSQQLTERRAAPPLS